ncbi:MAG: TIGR04168 family protein [Halothece sp. Uz-M2-17]|nr:TIGR04168 family protein [Halothece sp. Uz-M2-17]
MKGTLKPNCTIAVVGDIHDQWELKDNACLEALGVDLALFVGDFGNEAVGIVQRVSALQLPKAVILGNHDAHYSASKRGRKKCPYDATREDRVQQQLDLLGDTHVGYSKQDFHALHLSVVGSRPFSWGGPQWRNHAFYQQRYGVNGFEESTAQMMKAVHSTYYETTIFLAHNGPKGLGSQPHDLCGRDWKPGGGDYGDEDLRCAIAQTRQLGKEVPLVAFGHMHHQLRHTKDYQRTAIFRDQQGTIYFNAACVPRLIKTKENGQYLRKFFLVSLTPTGVREIQLVYMRNDFSIMTKEFFYQGVESSSEKLLS